MTQRFQILLKQHIQPLWQWARVNRIKTLFMLVGLFLLVQLLTIPWFGVARLTTEGPGETALMRQRIGEAERNEKPFAIRQTWVPITRIPRHVINAVVVAEDGTFWEHGGFDWYEFRQSLKKNWEKKRTVRGASTITQQLAKNLYLSTSKDPIRKLKEWMITLLLEHHLDKQRILEIYLNVIEWGRGIFGIEAAARTYFGRSASTLSVDQAIRLAAVIPSPLKHKPTDDSRWVSFRKNIVAARMQGRRLYEPDEPDEEATEESLSKETQSGQPERETLPADTGNAMPDSRQAPHDDVPRRETMPNDSTDIERGNSNDVQRREQAD